MGVRPYLPIPRKTLFRSPQQPGPYDHLFDAFGNPTEGLVSRLPQHYLKLIKPHPPPNRNWKVPSYPYHIVPKGANKPHIEKKYKQAMWAPIPVVYPKRSREELWAGEGMIFGYRQRDRYEAPHRTIWHPKLDHWTVYSEILDKHYKTIVSDTTLDLIDECHGFDFYILKTPPHELMSDFGMRIKGEILQCLAKRSYWSKDPEMHEMIGKKYEQFVIPLEEAEWVGLKPEEAVFKVQLSDKTEYDYRPLKEIYAEEEEKLLSTVDPSETSQIDANSNTSSSNWSTRLKNLFARN